MANYTNSEFLQVASIHKNELGGSDFISSCSVNFIKYFYKETTKNKFNQLFIVKDGDQVTGFVYFTLKKDTLFKDFVKDNIFKILITPSVLISLARTLMLKSKKTLDHQYNEDLVYIAVSKEHRSKGYARELLKQVENYCSENLLNSYYLQVYKDNENAVKFYQKYGFEIVEEYSARNKIKLLMRKSIS